MIKKRVDADQYPQEGISMLHILICDDEPEFASLLKAKITGLPTYSRRRMSIECVTDLRSITVQMGVCVLYSNFPYLASTHRRLSCSYTAWMPFGFIRVAGSVFVTCSSNKRSLRFDNGYSFVRSSNFSVGTSKPSRVAFKRQRIESGKTQNVCASSHYVFGLCCSATGASGDGCQLHCDGHLCGSSAFGGCAC